MDLRSVWKVRRKALTEEELANGCQRGDEEARRQLYERYAGRMFTICLRYAGSREEAEDILHDGFIRLYDQLRRFTWGGPGTLPAWMGKVMANVALQHLKRRDVMNQAVSWDDMPGSAAAATCDIADEEAAPESIPQEVLLRFIQELPDGYRAVFNLFVFEGKSHKEIAAELGINDHSSTSQLTRARATLVARIKDWQKKNG